MSTLQWFGQFAFLWVGSIALAFAYCPLLLALAGWLEERFPARSKEEP